MSNMEEQFVRLNARTSSVLQTLNEDSVDHQALVGVGPLFRSEAPAPAAAAPRKRSGNKPARNFVLVNSVEQNGVKIKFETSMDGLAMNAIIKRQFPELQSARNIIYHKARSAGNHALYKVGTDLAGSEVVANFKTPTTRVYVGPPDNIQAQEEVQVHFVSDEDVSAGGNEPPVHVAVTQGTPSPVTHSFTGKFGPQFHEVCFPGLLHADRTRCLATLNSASVCSGVPFVGISFKALCHHIKTAIKLGVVVILNVADKLSATERNLLCDLNTATITSDWDTQCLFWVSSSESGEAKEAMQALGGQTLGFPQLLLCAPSMSGSSIPIPVERFSGNFDFEAVVEAANRALPTLQIAHENRRKYVEEQALRAKQDTEFRKTSELDVLKEQQKRKRQSIGNIPASSTRNCTTENDPKENAVQPLRAHAASAVTGAGTVKPPERADALKENEVRLSRASRVNTAPAGPAGTIEVKIHTPIGQVKRKFCEGGLYQEVYDWIGSKADQPLYFALLHQATREVVLRRNCIEPGEVLILVERDEKEMDSLTSGKETYEDSTIPLQQDEADHTSVVELSDDEKSEGDERRGNKRCQEKEKSNLGREKGKKRKRKDSKTPKKKQKKEKGDNKREKDKKLKRKKRVEEDKEVQETNISEEIKEHASELNRRQKRRRREKERKKLNKLNNS